MTKLFCFHIMFSVPTDDDSEYAWYDQHERILFAGGLAAAARKAFDLCEKSGTEFQIRDHQPIMVDGEGNAMPGTYPYEVSLGPLYEAVYDPQKVPTLSEIREYLAFLNPRPFSPDRSWEVHDVR